MDDLTTMRTPHPQHLELLIPDLSKSKLRIFNVRCEIGFHKHKNVINTDNRSKRERSTSATLSSSTHSHRISTTSSLYSPGFSNTFPTPPYNTAAEYVPGNRSRRERSTSVTSSSSRNSNSSATSSRYSPGFSNIYPTPPYNTVAEYVAGIDFDKERSPYLEILGQPASHYPVRYLSEIKKPQGPIRSAQAVQSTTGDERFIRVRLCNYTTGQKVIIRCTLYTADKIESDRRIHVYRLVCKLTGSSSIEEKYVSDCDDPHDREVESSDYIAKFDNLVILAVKERNREQSNMLAHKMLRHCRKEFTNYNTNRNCTWDIAQFTDAAEIEAKRQSTQKLLNIMCLKFEALVDNMKGEYTSICPPVYSNIIKNERHVDTNILTIHQSDRFCGPCRGGQVVSILVSKVSSKNIKVKFYEENEDGEIVWFVYPDIQPENVHNQSAITFSTPRYRDLNIKENVQVFYQLVRPSDGDVSLPRDYEYLPDSNLQEEQPRKRPRQDSYLNCTTTQVDVSTQTDITAGMNFPCNCHLLQPATTDVLGVSRTLMQTDSVSQMDLPQNSHLVQPASNDILGVKTSMECNQQDNYLSYLGIPPDVLIDSMAQVDLQHNSRLVQPAATNAWRGDTSMQWMQQDDELPDLGILSPRLFETPQQLQLTDVEGSSDPLFSGSEFSEFSIPSISNIWNSWTSPREVMINHGHNLHIGPSCNIDLNIYDKRKTELSSISDVLEGPSGSTVKFQHSINKIKLLTRKLESTSLSEQENKNSNSSVGLARISSTERSIESNILKKVERTVERLVQLWKSCRIREKSFQDLLSRLFHFTYGKNGDSVLHLLAASPCTLMPCQATKFITVLKTKNIMETIVNIKNNRQETPLHTAARKGTLKMMMLLMKAGANVDATDCQNNTALHLIIMREQEMIDAVQALLLYKPSLTIYNNDGFTVLHLAVKHRKSNLVDCILAKCEDISEIINKPEKRQGNTALHLAVQSQFRDIVIQLLNYMESIDVNAKNFSGRTPLAFVMGKTDRNAKEIEDQLISNKADPDLVQLNEESEEEYEDNTSSESESEYIEGVEDDECLSQYSREWGMFQQHLLKSSDQIIFDKTVISKLCPLLDHQDSWRALVERFSYNDCEIKHCESHWSPSLMAFKIAALYKHDVTLERIKAYLQDMPPHLHTGAQYIDDMVLRLQ